MRKTIASPARGLAAGRPERDGCNALSGNACSSQCPARSEPIAPPCCCVAHPSITAGVSAQSANAFLFIDVAPQWRGSDGWAVTCDVHDTLADVGQRRVWPGTAWDHHLRTAISKTLVGATVADLLDVFVLQQGLYQYERHGHRMQRDEHAGVQGLLRSASASPSAMSQRCKLGACCIVYKHGTHFKACVRRCLQGHAACSVCAVRNHRQS